MLPSERLIRRSAGAAGLAVSALVVAGVVGAGYCRRARNRGSRD